MKDQIQLSEEFGPKDLKESIYENTRGKIKIRYQRMNNKE